MFLVPLVTPDLPVLPLARQMVSGPRQPDVKLSVCRSYIILCFCFNPHKLFSRDIVWRSLGSSMQSLSMSVSAMLCDGLEHAAGTYLSFRNTVMF